MRKLWVSYVMRGAELALWRIFRWAGDAASSLAVKRARAKGFRMAPRRSA